MDLNALRQVLSIEFFGNTVSDYLLAIAILLAGILGAAVLRDLIMRRLKRWAAKTATDLDDRLIHIFEQWTIPLVYLGSVYVSIHNLELHPMLEQAADAIAIILAAILAIRLLSALAEYLIRIYWLTQSDSANLEQTLRALIPAVKVLIWALGIIFVLENLGFDVSAVVTGLGIGGAAVALASQGVLRDLFSYFAILFDTPFELGDFIVVDDHAGSIEHIGIKTTRIRSLDGELLVFGNADLTAARIRNFKHMQERRIVFQLGVTYETGLQHLRQIPEIIEAIISDQEKVRFDRSHFKGYGDFSLNFETVYYVTTNDYAHYMTVQQQINFAIKDAFDQLGIEFAYPTQLLYLHNSPSEQSGNGEKEETVVVGRSTGKAGRDGEAEGDGEDGEAGEG
ncbi:MAG: mechanosensitive ion channel family protein [Leptolyngbyaceae cyanobacterium MO_188.B28]|nr:mechanosensitive ion channel family protein [Leptolyngbyaceae cyanobacterium MO_188.B28]